MIQTAVEAGIGGVLVLSSGVLFSRAWWQAIGRRAARAGEDTSRGQAPGVG